jgi:hypothetical protein
MLTYNLPSLTAIRLRDPNDISGLTEYWVTGMISIDHDRGLDWSVDLHNKLDHIYDVLYSIEVKIWK